MVKTQRINKNNKIHIKTKAKSPQKRNRQLNMKSH